MIEFLLSAVIATWKLEYLDAQNINQTEIYYSQERCYSRARSLIDRGHTVTNYCQLLYEVRN